MEFMIWFVIYVSKKKKIFSTFSLIDRLFVTCGNIYVLGGGVLRLTLFLLRLNTLITL